MIRMAAGVLVLMCVGCSHVRVAPMIAAPWPWRCSADHICHRVEPRTAAADEQLNWGPPEPRNDKEQWTVVASGQGYKSDPLLTLAATVAGEILKGAFAH